MKNKKEQEKETKQNPYISLHPPTIKVFELDILYLLILFNFKI